MKTVIIVIFAILNAVSCTINPVVHTPNGNIQGVSSTSYEGRIYSAFIGIPYAAPPLGSLRFKDPVPAEKWSGTWIANSTTYCIQLNHWKEPEGGPLMGDEDCLYLSVYVAKEAPKEGNDLDVVVHFHSGAFNFGSGDDYAGPKYLMDRDLVYVTVNHRLGPLGFMSTEDSVVPGNMGMKDQVAALQWVKDNIKYLGGNPNSITITGLSAGGVSVSMHMLSPLSRDLFTRGISVSGVSILPLAIQEGALEKARFVASEVGCETSSTSSMVECLRRRPARQIVQAMRLLRPWLYNPISPVAPVVDKWSSNPFMPEHPMKLMQDGKVKDAPWMTSVTSEEGLYPAADFAVKDNFLPDLERRWLELAPFVLDYNYTIDADKMDEISMKIKHHYLGEKAISKETYPEVIKMMSDRLFIYEAEVASRLMAKAMTNPVYFYYFSHTGEKVDTYAWHYTGSEAKYGVCHGDDIMFFLSNPKKPLARMTDADNKMRLFFLDIWSSFAKNGVPVINTGIAWIPVGKENEKFVYLHIASDKSIKMEKAMQLGERSFWEGLPLHE